MKELINKKITIKEIINKLENKLIESFGDMIEIKQGENPYYFFIKIVDKTILIVVLLY